MPPPITRSTAKGVTSVSKFSTPAVANPKQLLQFPKGSRVASMTEQELLTAFQRLKEVPDESPQASTASTVNSSVHSQRVLTAPTLKTKSKKLLSPKPKPTLPNSSFVNSLAQDIQTTNQNCSEILKVAIEAADNITSYHKIKFKVDSNKLISNVPTCSHNNPQAIVLFIEAVDKIFKLPNVDSLSLLIALSIKVDDHITEWWSTMMSKPWTEVRGALFSKYINNSDIILMCDKFINRLQREDESFESFVLDIKSKFCALNLTYPESHLISIIWAHCSKKTFDVIKHFYEPSTFSELDTIIYKIESIARREENFKHPNSFDIVPTISPPVNFQSRPPPPEQKRAQFCRYCRNYGHLLNECRKLSNKNDSYPKN
uniref:Retrotransposon gag domain-containing protein n=1 Tax=Photinus pyralis TaxID=7054 RepID=A0A1Y1LK19_PHOPY